jgi:ribose transport system substrate-binding protein
MRIAVFTKNRLNPAYAGARLGADRVAARFGASVLHYVPETPDDPVEQSALIDEALAQGVDAIVLVPCHPSAVAASVHKINAADVPLINCINRLALGEYVSYVGADDYALGFDVADYLCRRMDGQGAVVLVEGPEESVTGKERSRAFREALRGFPGIEVVGACRGAYLQEPARQALEALLPGLRRVDAVLAANDSMALGAIEALKASGRGALVAGINAVPEAVAAIKRGEMLVTCDFNAMDMAALATECAVRHLRGEAVPLEISLPAVLVDASNCEQWDRPYEERETPAWEDVAKGVPPGT